MKAHKEQMKKLGKKKKVHYPDHLDIKCRSQLLDTLACLSNEQQAQLAISAYMLSS